MIQNRTFGRRSGPQPAWRQFRAKDVDPPENAEPAATVGRSLLLDGARYFAAAVVAFVVIAMILNTNKDSAVQVASVAPQAAKVKCGATLPEFYEMRAGMTYAEVRDIVGCEGEIISQMNLMGSNRVTVSWDAQNARFGSMTASFHDGTLVSRMQFNLK